MRRLSLPLAVVLLVAPLFAASGGIPTVNQPLFPSSVQPGSAAFTLRVDGSAFAPGAVVNWNGVPLVTTVVNRSRLRAAVPAANVANAGTVNVTVTNPAPGGGTSSPVFLTVTAPTASLTFATSVFDVGLAPGALAEGDFNNDGKADLAVLNLNQTNACYTEDGVGTVQILLGNGAGSFSTASTNCFPNGPPAGVGLPVIMAEDFFGNGKLGVAAEFYSASVDQSILEIFSGNGDGTLSGGGTFSVTDEDVAIVPAFADFNNDGYLDFAFAQGDPEFPGINLYYGSSNGIFTFGGGGILINGTGVVAGDFNGDGIQDLAVLDYSIFPQQGPVGIVLGGAGGTFVQPTSQPTTTLVNPVSVTTGDFNGDGILDLAFADSGSTALTVLLGNGDGTFTQKTGQSDAGQTTKFIATADLNGDGKLDLVLVDSANAVLIYRGNGDGTFQTALEVAAGNGASQLAIGDFNGDGRLDIAVTNSSDNTVSILLQAPSSSTSSTSLKFGKVAVGSTSNPQRVFLTNSGSATLRLSSFIASGDFAETNNCGTALYAGHSCVINVVFKPTATGLRTGNVTVTDNAVNGPQVIQLTGNGD